MFVYILHWHTKQAILAYSFEVQEQLLDILCKTYCIQLMQKECKMARRRKILNMYPFYTAPWNKSEDSHVEC